MQNDYWFIMDSKLCPSDYFKKLFKCPIPTYACRISSISFRLLITSYINLAIILLIRATLNN